MARTKKKTGEEQQAIQFAPITPQPITETIEKNYMPYVMTVILSRAIPEIDGLKPAHRKLLYTMYKMGLLTGNRKKSVTVVGETLKLNPHGDAAVYDTMVRLTRDYEALLHPLIDSKGAFGKQYSTTDMKSAAPRYTEVKLDPFSAELFSGIEKDAVDMVDNFDNTMKEPTLLPTTYPNVLVMPNSGIAVGMASDICSFNLEEICDGTIALLKNPDLPIPKLMEIIKAPDFAGGGLLLYEENVMTSVFKTGQGSIRLRARYNYDKANNCIDIFEIPYSTSIEMILGKLTSMAKAGKLKEITDFRDEIGIDGFKITIDLRRGTDPDALMKKLFHYTPLEAPFKCNFNILVNAVPRQMGVKDILLEWIHFRMGCVRREMTYDLKKKQEKLHLLEGLGKILLDIDKAIRIIRKTEKDEMVIPNLMEGFSIDEIQANYIAEIKLRNLNRSYLLDRIGEINSLRQEIDNLQKILADDLLVKGEIIKQLREIKKKYAQPRRTLIVDSKTVETYDPTKAEPSADDVPTRLFLTAEGYFKRLAPPRPNAAPEEHKLKDGDKILVSIENAKSDDELLIFTNRSQAYRVKVSDFDIIKANVIGDYLPSKLGGMEEGERPILMIHFSGKFPAKDRIVLIFQNGKGVRIPLSAYETKSNRKRMTGAYSDASPIVAILHEKPSNPLEILLVGTDHRGILIKSDVIPEKTTRTSVGVQLVSMRPGAVLDKVVSAPAADNLFPNTKSYRKAKIPSATVEIKASDFPNFPNI